MNEKNSVKTKSIKTKKGAPSLSVTINREIVETPEPIQKVSVKFLSLEIEILTTESDKFRIAALLDDKEVCDYVVTVKEFVRLLQLHQTHLNENEIKET